MINNIIIILMTLTLIINTYKLIYYYQNDNYHFRIFKIILFKDIKYKPYIFLYIIFLFCKKNSIIKYLLLIFSLINICFEYRIKKIKNTNRIKRLFLIYFIFLFLLIYLIKNITSKKLKGLPSRKIAELPEETVTETEEPMMETENTQDEEV